MFFIFRFDNLRLQAEVLHGAQNAPDEKAPETRHGHPDVPEYLQLREPWGPEASALVTKAGSSVD